MLAHRWLRQTKTFGFPIHGAIDGHSRKILWLKVVQSNNNPKVIADLYLDVSNLRVVPKTVRNDCGTENIIVARMQCYFRRNHNDEQCGERSYVYGSSHTNQRIEALCSISPFQNDIHHNFFKNVDTRNWVQVWGSFAKVLCLVLLWRWYKLNLISSESSGIATTFVEVEMADETQYIIFRKMDFLINHWVLHLQISGPWNHI